MGLAAEGHGAVGYDGTQLAKTLRRRHHHAFVALQRACALLEIGRRHIERQRHVAFLKRMVVGQCRRILLATTQHHLVLRGCGDLIFARDVLGGLHHGVAAERVVAEIVEHPVLMRRGAARRRRVRIDNVWTIGDAIAGRDQRSGREPGFDFLGAGEQATHARRASLADGRAADLGAADQAHEPRQAVERRLLRHRHAEHAVVEGVGRDVPLGKLGLGDMGGKFDAVQVGETALPFGKGRAPIGAVGNFRQIRHARALTAAMRPSGLL
jgi:hypothetical protein